MKIPLKNYIFLTFSILLSCLAQLSMKAGMLILATMAGEHGVLSDPMVLWDSNAIFWVVGGLGCYGVSMLFWMAAITKFDLSFAYPMLSLSYVLVYIAAAAWPFLNETISMTRSVGILIIVFGVVLIVRTHSRHTKAV